MDSTLVNMDFTTNAMPSNTRSASPLLAYAPGKIKAGTEVDEMILNIDLAPTLLEFAGIKKSRKHSSLRWTFLQTPSR